MTIKLLADRPPYPIGALLSLTTAEETALVADKLATTTLTGGFVFTPPVQVRPDDPVNQLSVQQVAKTQALVSTPGILSGAARGAGSRKLWGRPTSTGANSGGNYTHHQTLALPIGCVGVKFRFWNVHSLAVATYKAAFAWSTTAIDGDATIRNTTGGAWTQITVGGSTSITVPAVASGTSAIDWVAGYVDSDEMYVPSLPRADGAAGSILMIRDYWNVSENGSRADQSWTTGLPTFAAQGVFQTYRSGDYVTANQATYDASLTCQAFGPAIEVIPLYVSNTPSLMGGGDSTYQGAGDTGDFGWIARLGRQLNAAGKPILVTTHGWGGQYSNTYWLSLLAKIALDRPSIAAYQVYSPNDTDRFTAAGQARQMGQMAKFLATCRQYGAVPVVTTPLPENGLASGNETVRRATAALIRAAGCPVIDFDAVMADNSAATGAYKSGLNNDSLHPNTAGYDVMATEAYRVVMPIVAALAV